MNNNGIPRTHRGEKRLSTVRMLPWMTVSSFLVPRIGGERVAAVLEVRTSVQNPSTGSWCSRTVARVGFPSKASAVREAKVLRYDIRKTRVRTAGSTSMSRRIRYILRTTKTAAAVSSVGGTVRRGSSTAFRVAKLFRKNASGADRIHMSPEEALAKFKQIRRDMPSGTSQDVIDEISGVISKLERGLSGQRRSSNASGADRIHMSPEESLAKFKQIRRDMPSGTSQDVIDEISGVISKLERGLSGQRRASDSSSSDKMTLEEASRLPRKEQEEFVADMRVDDLVEYWSLIDAWLAVHTEPIAVADEHGTTFY